MVAVYLYINALLYFVFALLCTVWNTDTSKNLGYSVLSRSGESEYVVVYGGMQVGLGVIFAWLAQTPTTRDIGLQIALCLYIPIVLYRWVTIGLKWPVGGMTIGVGALETALLFGALYLWIAKIK